MMTEADLQFCTALMIRLFGPAASARALARATDSYQRGDREAARIWIQVGSAIHRMEEEKPRPGETVQ
jgi:hypothetical protein